MTQHATTARPRPAKSAPAAALSPTLVALTLLAAVLTLATSLLGLLADWPYVAETANWKAQGQAQDAGNLVAVVVLLAGLAGARRGSVRSRQVWLGALLYLAYAFVLYAMTVHFGPLFLPYVAVLGLSVYGVLFGCRHQAERIRVHPMAIRIAAVTLGVIGGLFALLWLAAIASALVSGQPPADLVEAGLPANPVHVLDLALVLPAMVLTAVRAGHDPSARFLLVPWLVFSALMAVSIVILMALTPAAGPGLAVVGVIASASAVVAVLTLRLTTELP